MGGFLAILAKCRDQNEWDRKENGEQRGPGLEAPGPKLWRE